MKSSGGTQSTRRYETALERCRVSRRVSTLTRLELTGVQLTPEDRKIEPGIGRRRPSAVGAARPSLRFRDRRDQSSQAEASSLVWR